MKRERIKVSAVGAEEAPSMYFPQHEIKSCPVPHGQGSAGPGVA
ncbi:hypothetical protein [Rhodococcus sp. 27YEA15]